MAKHQARLARRSPTVLSFYDLDISAADSDGDGFYEYRAFTRIWFRHVLELCASWLLGLNSDGFHFDTFRGCTLLAVKSWASRVVDCKMSLSAGSSYGDASAKTWQLHGGMSR